MWKNPPPDLPHSLPPTTQGGRHHHPCWLGLMGLALVFFGACAPSPPPPQPRNVVLILVDTLRADHLGAYGYGRPTSPNLDAFARGAVLFQDARSQASCTFPSANSLLTSRYPAAFMGQPEQAMGIPGGIPSVAEVLQGKGYRTVAVSASPIVRKSPTRFNPQGGFARGFETFSEDCLWKPAECVNRVTMEQLEQLEKEEDGRPFFLYLHYMDPHGPYAPPPGHVRRFATGSPDKAFIREGNPNPIGDMLYKGAPDPGATPADLQHLVGLYDDEIAYFDAQLALLLQRLRETGRMEDTLVVLTSDHGEEFLEHGHIKHCRTLFDTSIRIPLILHVPGAAPRTVTRPAENVDVVPTLLDLLGIGTEGLRLEGRSLRPLLGDEESDESPDHQFSAQGPLRSVADGGFKLVEDLAGGSVALYDLRADPGETKDVLRDRRRDFHRLRQALTAWLAATEGQHAAGESVHQAEEAERKLRALGYIE
ncbi:MAG TPA: sulfatase [Thermoanaerobaculia bacterium]|nr:sulfatase [Thermoanaerobaculia bacterium]